ncbi:MAG: accessory factor UbiK family protein [Gammaproteobacteria bacterium]|nr:accessory factor UbiK family protein [Gammaproteobacteria bacterium]
MIDPRILDQLGSKLSELLPSGAGVLKEDVERNMRANVQAIFARMDLVSGEEFAVQSALLERTRLKLDNLEQRVTELEQALLQQNKA